MNKNIHDRLREARQENEDLKREVRDLQKKASNELELYMVQMENIRLRKQLGKMA